MYHFSASRLDTNLLQLRGWRILQQALINFDVLLTVYLSVNLVNDKLDVQFFVR